MTNPWLKKNPFMSMWLSGANTVLNSARGRATAEGKRQAAGMMAEGRRQMVDRQEEAVSLKQDGSRQYSRRLPDDLHGYQVVAIGSN